MWTCLAPEQQAARGRARSRQEHSLTVTRWGMRSPGPRCIFPNKSGGACVLPAEGEQASRARAGPTARLAWPPLPATDPVVNGGDTFSRAALCPWAPSRCGLGPSCFRPSLQGAEGTPEVPSTPSSPSPASFSSFSSLAGHHPPASEGRHPPSIWVQHPGHSVLRGTSKALPTSQWGRAGVSVGSGTLSNYGPKKEQQVQPRQVSQQQKACTTSAPRPRHHHL